MTWKFLCSRWRGNKNLVGERGSLMGGFFQVGEIITFLAGGRTHPIPPLSLYIYISFVYIICIMCPSDHLTSARFVHFVCHRYIWYIFSCLFSVHNTTNLSYHMFNQAQWWEKYLCIFRSNFIKHTCSWRDIKHKVKWMVKLVKKLP